MDMEPLYHYVIVRRDLPIGVAAAQIVHAAGESFAEYMYEAQQANGQVEVPLGVHAIVLSVKTEQELFRLAFDLTKAKAVVVPITEDSRNGELCAIGIVPCLRSTALNEVLGSLRLYMPGGLVPPSAHEVFLVGSAEDGNVGTDSAPRQGQE